MDYSRYKCLRVEKRGGVGVIACDYPEAENRIDFWLHSELESIWEDIGADDEINVAVLTGTGSRFIGGIDPGFIEKALLERDASLPIVTQEGARRLLYSFLELEKPVIAAVNGPAVGLGATMALFCDIVIAAESASFSDPHVLWGIVAGDGGAIIWPLLVGMAKAKEALLTGDVVPAAEAERIGLANRVVPDGELMPVAMSLAQRLAQGATRAIRGTKICFNKRLREEVNLAFDLGLSLEWDTMRRRDHREAVRAYSRGEKPKFTGR